MGYLEKWDTSVNSWAGFTLAEQKMRLSDETLAGLRVTGMRHMLATATKCALELYCFQDVLAKVY